MRSLVLGLLIAASPASAEVKSASDVGFAVERTVVVDASPERAFAALVQPSLWWSSAHTWSGDAKNLSLDLRAGGCFCEALPKVRGGVEHARVVYFASGAMLRLSGALGPLQGEAATGTLTFMLKPDGSKTAITLSYVVGGYLRPGPRNLAAPVDGVLGEQLTRLAAHIDGRKAAR
jgi:uncharacterized protein YndB with AHSA1/START domain